MKSSPKATAAAAPTAPFGRRGRERLAPEDERDGRVGVDPAPEGGGDGEEDDRPERRAHERGEGGAVLGVEPRERRVERGAEERRREEGDRDEPRRPAVPARRLGAREPGDDERVGVVLSRGEEGEREEGRAAADEQARRPPARAEAGRDLPREDGGPDERERRGRARRLPADDRGEASARRRDGEDGERDERLGCDPREGVPVHPLEAGEDRPQGARRREDEPEDEGEPDRRERRGVRAKEDERAEQDRRERRRPRRAERERRPEERPGEPAPARDGADDERVLPLLDEDEPELDERPRGAERAVVARPEATGERGGRHERERRRGRVSDPEVARVPSDRRPRRALRRPARGGEAGGRPRRGPGGLGERAHAGSPRAGSSRSAAARSPASAPMRIAARRATR
jgi:hypothetical protein